MIADSLINNRRKLQQVDILTRGIYVDFATKYFLECIVMKQCNK